MSGVEEAWWKGIEQFNRGEFFECHETLEAIWLSAPEPERTFLQGIIQVAAAFHHLRRDNPAGARSLLETGLNKLDSFPANHRGIQLEALRSALRLWIALLEGGGRTKSTQTPVINRSP